MRREKSNGRFPYLDQELDLVVCSAVVRSEQDAVRGLVVYACNVERFSCFQELKVPKKKKRKVRKEWHQCDIIFNQRRMLYDPPHLCASLNLSSNWNTSALDVLVNGTCL
jgi:hypothetical protein